MNLLLFFISIRINNLCLFHKMSAMNAFLIYYIDEIGLQHKHRPPPIMTTKGGKPQATSHNIPRSTTTTLIACVNAPGTPLPPLCMYKGKGANGDLLDGALLDLLEGAILGTGLAMSDSMWSNGVVLKYLQKKCLKYTQTGANANEYIYLCLMAIHLIYH